ncbi:MAG: NADH-quinone oxidoreductase subunit C [Geodermatophilaceae bacterium]
MTDPVPGHGSPDRGMFGVSGTGDTSGFGGLVRVDPGAAVVGHSTPRPYGGYYDRIADRLGVVLRGMYDAAVQRVVVDRGEITFFVAREHILALCQTLRDDAELRFELCSAVSAVDYLDSGTVGLDDSTRLHVVYHLTSMTYRRRIRLEVVLGIADPHVPSVTGVYPTADWQERETWDMFGIVFDGHPALTRILMPDDWAGHPQRKDYPLGGVPVEYKGATIPPPDERRVYQ